MGVPRWWEQRRYGLFVHANIATVPAWAPIGQYADWYWSQLRGDLPDSLLQTKPLVETLAHHRDRWDFVEHFDDFLPLLTYDRFDAEDWARLAVDAGMGYTVFVTKHHDGLCWWDAPNTTRTSALCLTSSAPQSRQRQRCSRASTVAASGAASRIWRNSAASPSPSWPGIRAATGSQSRSGLLVA